MRGVTKHKRWVERKTKNIFVVSAVDLAEEMEIKNIFDVSAGDLALVRYNYSTVVYPMGRTPAAAMIVRVWTWTCPTLLSFRRQSVVVLTLHELLSFNFQLQT